MLCTLLLFLFTLKLTVMYDCIMLQSAVNYGTFTLVMMVRLVIGWQC